MNTKIELKLSALVAIVIFVSLARLIPNMPNFSPLAAIALFCAAHFDKLWKAISTVLLASFISDTVLNNTLYASMHSDFTLFYDGFIWQYAAYGIILLLGSRVFQSISATKVIAGSVMASLLFFIVSNFGAWVSLPFYPKNGQGLVSAYVAGLPFLKNTLLSDLTYSSILFGGYYLLQRRFSFLRLPYLHYA